MEFKPPVLFINFKTYKEASGGTAITLAKKAEEVAKEKGVTIVLVVQAVDIERVASAVSLPVFSQHIDPVSYGSNTGHIMPEAVKAAGAKGTVLNHAENKRDNDFIGKALKRAKEIGLIVMICAETTERAKELAVLKPDLIAVEPPELIGGEVSVSTANPKIISNSVKAVNEINSEILVVCGAGVKTTLDVKKSIELGAKGVFVASGVVKAKDQKKAIEELVKGFG